MKFCCRVEKTAEKIEDACRFTSRLLEHGDAVEILALRRIVGAQLMNLIKNTPKHNVTFSIEFQTDYNQFEKTVQVNIIDNKFYPIIYPCNIRCVKNYYRRYLENFTLKVH